MVILAAREKLIRGRDSFTPVLPESDIFARFGIDDRWRAVAESHLYCAGEGCDKRLAKRRRFEDADGNKSAAVTLEPRYTDKPSVGHAVGTWRREEKGGYKGMPRGRDIRKAHGIPRGTPNEWGPQLNKAVAAMTSLIFGESDPNRRRAGPRRATERPTLPPGTHIVACYGCRGLARIDA